MTANKSPKFTLHFQDQVHITLNKIIFILNNIWTMKLQLLDLKTTTSAVY